MDRDVVSAKIESLRHCVQRIREKTPASAELLEQDMDRQESSA
ncbi:MAG: hypothetical protein H6Q05_5038 [Acidobacteria bacterium]|nr:hypothetical protein [Acidobacteriota bacterium]